MNRSEIVVRRAVPEDAALIAEILLRAFGEWREHYTTGAFAEVTPSAEQLASRFAEGPIWIAEKGGEAIGTVSGLPEDERFYIRSMAVRPGLQGGGVGQKLLGVLEAYAREHKFSKLYLYTTGVLPAARHLYEKNGFHVLRETLPEEWFDVGGLEMEKILN